MSEINKNNLEEFFSNSMEHFDSTPSDLVWEGISDRLDDDDQKPIFWWRRYLWMALPIIGVGLIAIYFASTKHDAPHLIEQPISQHVTNQNESNNQNYKPEDNKLTKDQNENIALYNSKTSSQNLSTDQRTSDNFSSVLKSTNHNKLQPQINNIEQQLLVDQTTPTRNKVKLETNNLGSLNNDLFKNNFPVDTVIQQYPEQITNSLITNSTVDEKGTKEVIDKSKQKETFAYSKLELPSNLEHHRILNAPSIVIIKNENNTSKYRLGITGRFANTFVSDNNMFNGNESYGMRQEYYITNKLAITNAIHFNIQHYDIEPGTQSIEPVIVKRYTSRSFDDTGGVQKIESNSEYLDFSLGLKYDLKKRFFGFNTFINPSFVGQIYSPQTFSFLDLEGNLRIRENKRVVMYLGSANMNFGIEKRLNKHMYLQVSIWGENSFIPIGLQREKIKTLGISTSLLFGN